MKLHYLITGATAAMVAHHANAQFGAEVDMPQDGPRGVEVRDLDNDGDNDVLIASRSGLQVFLNTDGQGTLGAPVMVDVNESLGHAVDVNGDGYHDMIGSGSFAGGIRWFGYTGTFGYAPAIELDPVANAWSIASGDIDADGDADLVFALEDNTIQWSENTDGLGSFSPLNMLVYATSVVGLSIYDVDNDGDQDVAWTTAMSNQALWADNTNGQGVFNAPLLLSSSGRGVHADLDGDGRRDLAMVDPWTDQVLWQRRQYSAVGFGIAHPISLSVLQPGAVMAEDMDGDGDNDLVASSWSTDEILYYENTDGQGHFGPAQVVAYGVAACDVLGAGDLDGDGDMELFAGSGPQMRIIRMENLHTALGMITGRVFNDIDGDGQFGGGDHGLYNVRVDLAGAGHTYTNHSGMYWFPAAPGMHTIGLPTVTGWNTTSAASVSVNVPAAGSLGNDFTLQAATIDHEVTATLSNAPTRCGTAIAYWITVENNGNQVDDLNLSLDLDNISGYISASPAPVTNAAGLQSWQFTDVAPTHQRTVTLLVQLADATYMGQIMHDELQITSVHGGSTVLTTVCQNDPVLECAFDPNDKQVTPVGAGDAHLTAMDALLTYTIRFQNTGTIPAIDVVIHDQLDTDLDPQSVHFVGASHPVHMMIDDNGAITFTFNGIMLPDSGSDLAGSQGYVRFNVRAFSGLPDLTPVDNHAEIVFDANPAIITNTTTNTLTYGMTGVGEAQVNGDAFIQVRPNPAFDLATIHIGSGLVGRVTIDVFDEAGQKVIRLVRNTNTIIIHREDMPAGVYLLRATDENGREAMTRLVWGR